MDDDAISDPRKYMKLAELLRARIARGQIAPGDKLPTIAVLAEEQDVSRQTVGMALQYLAQQSLVRRVAGLGYYVRARLPADLDTDVDLSSAGQGGGGSPPGGR